LILFNQGKIKESGGEKIDKKHICIVCGEEHGLDNIHTIDIKGKTQKICKGCATAIKGLA